MVLDPLRRVLGELDVGRGELLHPVHQPGEPAGSVGCRVAGPADRAGRFLGQAVALGPQLLRLGDDRVQFGVGGLQAGLRRPESRRRLLGLLPVLEPEPAEVEVRGGEAVLLDLRAPAPGRRGGG